MTVTLRDVAENGETFCCPSCGHLSDLSQQYDMTNVDTLTVECPCGHEETYASPDACMPGEIVAWRGHRIGRNQDGIPLCIDCEKTARAFSVYSDTEARRVREMPMAKLTLFVLAEIGDRDCAPKV